MADLSDTQRLLLNYFGDTYYDNAEFRLLQLRNAAYRDPLGDFFKQNIDTVIRILEMSSEDGQYLRTILIPVQVQVTAPVTAPAPAPATETATATTATNDDDFLLLLALEEEEESEKIEKYYVKNKNTDNVIHYTAQEVTSVNINDFKGGFLIPIISKQITDEKITISNARCIRPETKYAVYQTEEDLDRNQGADLFRICPSKDVISNRVRLHKMSKIDGYCKVNISEQNIAYTHEIQ